MRGEACQILGSLLAATSLILSIFVHVGQINTTSLPRGISMVKINTSEYANTLSAITVNADKFDDIYTNNASAPLNEKQGLRQLYLFGLYSHCAYVNETSGICSKETIGVQYRPYDELTSDMPLKESTLTDSFHAFEPIRDSDHLGSEAKGAYWCILIGTILPFVAVATGWKKDNKWFFISTFSAIAGAIALLSAAAIWTDIVKRSQGLNSQVIGQDIPLGMTVSTGTGLYLLWASFATLLLSTLPFLLSCCTWRG